MTSLKSRSTRMYAELRVRSSKRAVNRALKCALACLMLHLTGCGVRPLNLREREVVERAISQRSVELVKAKRLPDQTPMREVELARSLLKAHPSLARHLTFFITAGDLTSQSVRRLGRGRVGDLVVFQRLPRALPLAIVTESLSPTRYRAIGILRGEIRLLEIDLSSPDKRRRDGAVINTVIRTVQPDDAPPYLYLAGELFSEFRSLF